MQKLKRFIKTTILGGLLVILPLAILLFAVSWLFNLVRRLIGPLTELLASSSPMHGVLADLVVIGLILAGCFLVGVLVQIRLGRIMYLALESLILSRVPGYSLVKETVAQFLGRKKSPFSAVALVRLFGNDTLVSAFITDTHPDGRCTVFVPTGPNPTSGNMYHVAGENVFPVDASVEDTMRSILSCGAGSTMLVSKLAESVAAGDGS